MRKLEGGHCPPSTITSERETSNGHKTIEFKKPPGTMGLPHHPYHRHIRRSPQFYIYLAIDAMNERIAQLDNRITRMESRVDERLGKIEERLDKLNENYIDHLERHLDKK